MHKATIMPRGNALGMVMQLPEGDQTSMSRKQMLAKMDVCMGGRVAEEMVFGPDNVTSGATSDLQQVCDFGGDQGAGGGFPPYPYSTNAEYVRVFASTKNNRSEACVHDAYRTPCARVGGSFVLPLYGGRSSACASFSR